MAENKNPQERKTFKFSFNADACFFIIGILHKAVSRRASLCGSESVLAHKRRSA